MKIENAEQFVTRLHENFGELQDGLFAIAGQKHLIDMHVCRYVTGEPEERAFYVIEERKFKEDQEVLNYSYVDHNLTEASDHVAWHVYDNREEAFTHFFEFQKKNNHF